MRIVIKLGGFLFSPEPRAKLLADYASLFKELWHEGHRCVVVTGGGEGSRKYIQIARELGASEALCDEVGIEATRLNAKLLIAVLGEDVYPEIPKTLAELRGAFGTQRIIVMGGLTPGHSTDAVAALAAEVVNADTLIRTIDVEGVYTADPKQDPTAKKLDEVSPSELAEMILKGRFWAGSYPLLDLVAIKIIERSRIPTWIVNGSDPENVRRVLRGESVGTFVTVES